jgi:uncharacterized protein
MMLHLTPADYTRQAWKNGRGTTTELLRLEHAGQLQLRLSRASVVADGPFSLFPGIQRNLTVLSGPGFRLSGSGLELHCQPLCPVAFPGDVELTASETDNQPSEDFNVMTARHLPQPVVTVERSGMLDAPGWCALYALGRQQINGEQMAPGDLIVTDAPVALTNSAPVIVVRLFGLQDMLRRLIS